MCQSEIACLFRYSVCLLQMKLICEIALLACQVILDLGNIPYLERILMWTFYSCSCERNYLMRRSMDVRRDQPLYFWSFWFLVRHTMDNAMETFDNIFFWQCNHPIGGGRRIGWEWMLLPCILKLCKHLVIGQIVSLDWYYEFFICFSIQK
jgi:hypothetical protein